MARLAVKSCASCCVQAHLLVRSSARQPHEARARLIKEGQPPVPVDSLLAIAAYQRPGGPTETITTVVQDVTGHAPRTFAELAGDYADAFQG